MFAVWARSIASARYRRQVILTGRAPSLSIGQPSDSSRPPAEERSVKNGMTWDST